MLIETAIKASEDIKDLYDTLEAALEYIDALPSEVVAALPPMPGFSRDDAEMLMQEVHDTYID